MIYQPRKKILLYVSFCLFTMMQASVTLASHQTHCDLGFGYHFYCDDKRQVQEKNQPEERPEKNQKKEGKPRNHKAELETMQKELQARKVRAVVEPTEENLVQYMEYQKQMLDRSSTFADVWRRILWKYPELDYTVKHPTNTIAKHKQIDIKRENVKEMLLRLNERYGLFFVYKSTCPYCHQYSGILKEFNKMYGVDILPITLDGIAMEDWKRETIKDLSVLKKLGLEQIKQVPATVLFDNKTKQVLPVGYGVLSISDLEQRIFVLINGSNDDNGNYDEEYEGF